MTRRMLSPMKMQTPLVSGFGSERQMKGKSRIVCARSAILAAGAFLCLVTLGGCAGGGGGGDISVAPVPFVYPASLKDATSSDTVDGFISPYALDPYDPLDPSTPKLVSTTPTVSGTSPSAGTITITVNAITLPDSSTEQAFSVKFDPADSTSTPVANSPLEGLSLSPQCANCLKTVTAYAIVGGTPTLTPVTFTYVDPASFSLTYSALGMWAKPTTTNGGSPDPNWPQIGGAFSAGVLTRGIDLPTTGFANYSGYFIGRYATSAPSGPAPGTYIVGANASATADFGAGTVSFSTVNTNIALEGGTPGTPFAMSGLDLTSGSMPIARTSTSNSFGGFVSTSNSLSGPIQGGFYGPPATTGDFAPPELGGSLSVTQ